jgi:hypothetical protein
MITVTLQLPPETVRWLDGRTKQAGSNAQNTGDQVAELVRITERNEKTRTESWGDAQEQAYLDFQRTIGNG